MSTWQVIQEDLHKLCRRRGYATESRHWSICGWEQQWTHKRGRRALIENIIIIILFSDGFDFDGGEIDSDKDEIHNHTLI